MRHIVGHVTSCRPFITGYVHCPWMKYSSTVLGSAMQTWTVAYATRSVGMTLILYERTC
jgi:hypothetical protein